MRQATTRQASTAAGRSRGKKRHILLDRQGLLMHARLYATDVQDRGALARATPLGMFPFLLSLCAGVRLIKRVTGLRWRLFEKSSGVIPSSLSRSQNERASLGPTHLSLSTTRS
jgi:hypothetical protein